MFQHEEIDLDYSVYTITEHKKREIEKKKILYWVFKYEQKRSWLKSTYIYVDFNQDLFSW